MTNGPRTFEQYLAWRELHAGGTSVAELARASGADARTVAWGCIGVEPSRQARYLPRPEDARRTRANVPDASSRRRSGGRAEVAAEAELYPSRPYASLTKAERVRALDHAMCAARAAGPRLSTELEAAEVSRAA